MNHLREAKMHTERAVTTIGAYRAQVNATLAIAHALIAICEQRNKEAADEEAAAYRAELLQEREARRAMEILP